MTDAELLAAIVADRRLTHYQVTVLWAVVVRLSGNARGRFSHGDLGEDLRADRKTICRALSTLPEGTAVRAELAPGVSTLFVVPSREPADAEPAREVEMTCTPEVQPRVPESPNAVRSRDSVVQADPPAEETPVPHRYRLEPPPVPESPNAARRWDSEVQVTGVHTRTLSADWGGIGGGLPSPSNRLALSERSDAGAREAGNGNGDGRRICDSDANGTELRLRAQRYLRDPLGAGLESGSAETWDEVVEVAKRFTSVWGREVRLSGGAPAVRRIVDRLAEGYTVAELCQAVTGAHNDPFYLDNGQFQNLHTILRDGGQVERFNVIAKTPPSSKKAPQPNYGVNILKGHELIGNFK